MKTAVTVMDLQAEKHAPPEPLELPPSPPLSLPDIWERPLVVRSAPAWWKIIAVVVAIEAVLRGIWR